MNNFLLFAFDKKLCSGGWDNFLKSFSTLSAAKTAVSILEKGAFPSDYYQVVDLKKKEVVFEKKRFEADQ